MKCNAFNLKNNFLNWYELVLEDGLVIYVKINVPADSAVVVSVSTSAGGLHVYMLLEQRVLPVK